MQFGQFRREVIDGDRQVTIQIRRGVGRTQKCGLELTELFIVNELEETRTYRGQVDWSFLEISHIIINILDLIGLLCRNSGIQNVLTQLRSKLSLGEMQTLLALRGLVRSHGVNGISVFDAYEFQVYDV